MERDRILGMCGTCNRPVYNQCYRICDGCSGIFCMFDIIVRDTRDDEKIYFMVKK